VNVLNYAHNETHKLVVYKTTTISQSVDSSCFGICPLISTEQSTMAHTFAIVETYSFTKAYLKSV